MTWRTRISIEDVIFEDVLLSFFSDYLLSLIQDELYVLKIKEHIENIISSFDSLFNQQIWEFLKSEICKSLKKQD